MWQNLENPVTVLRSLNTVYIRMCIAILCIKYHLVQYRNNSFHKAYKNHWQYVQSSKIKGHTFSLMVKQQFHSIYYWLISENFGTLLYCDANCVLCIMICIESQIQYMVTTPLITLSCDSYCVFLFSVFLLYKLFLQWSFTLFCHLVTFPKPPVPRRSFCSQGPQLCCCCRGTRFMASSALPTPNKQTFYV